MPDINLKKRTFEIALALPYNLINRAYLNQIIRSSSSIGANYRAAQRAKSTNDFINKLKIVEEENDETIYFLELLLVFNPDHSNNIISLINEGTELLKIIVSSINTIKERLNNQKK